MLEVLVKLLAEKLLNCPGYQLLGKTIRAAHKHRNHKKGRNVYNHLCHQPLLLSFKNLA